MPLLWHTLLKLRRAKPGAVINLLSNTNTRSGAWLRLIEPAPTETSEHAGADGWIVAVEHDRTWPPATTTKDILERVGLPPLPPYILASRKRDKQPIDDPRDRDTYQTVFAAPDEKESHGRGSVAAPTAGLHLTPELLAALTARGVDRAEVMLHVGMGTFKPVETEFVEQHPMHSEWCHIPRATALALQGSAHSLRTIIALGTTTARTLESFSSTDEMLATPSKDTRILITPGHRFQHVGALMTNFHLPRSTLLAMVAAFLDDTDHVRGQGLPRLLDAYRIAIEQRYRFYSFGDAMLILP